MNENPCKGCSHKKDGCNKRCAPFRLFLLLQDIDRKQIRKEKEAQMQLEGFLLAVHQNGKRYERQLRRRNAK